MWLAEKLRDLNTDEGVFLPYILSILEGEEESDEEKREGLTGILADCLDTEEAIESALNDIIRNWKSSARSKITDDVTENVQKLDITEKMHAITQEKISNNTIKKIEKSEEEKKLKEAILIGFGDGKADADDDDDGDSGGADLGPANTNSESVQKVMSLLITSTSTMLSTKTCPA